MNFNASAFLIQKTDPKKILYISNRYESGDADYDGVYVNGHF